MASQTTTTPKRATRAAAKTTASSARPARKESETPTNGNKRAKSGSRAKPLREMTLEELSLRAYKMTYDQLHGNKKKKK